MMSKIPKQLIGTLSYSGKCNDYDENDDMESPIFEDATEMAQCVDDSSKDVLTLTKSQFKQLLLPTEDAIPGCVYQINIAEGVAWAYHEESDIHYFYSL